MDIGCVISAGAGPTRCMVANGYQPRSQHWHWVKQPFWSFWLALLGAVQPHVMHSWYLNGCCLEMLHTHTRAHTLTLTLTLTLTPTPTLTLTLTLTHGDRYMCHCVWQMFFRPSNGRIITQTIAEHQKPFIAWSPIGSRVLLLVVLPERPIAKCQVPTTFQHPKILKGHGNGNVFEHAKPVCNIGQPSNDIKW
jgi:hypothetical protein